jgi:NADH:ubiquinone oxidoreductase subunit E
MKSPAKAKLRKVVYRGDSLAEPPAELSTLLDRHRGERDALITVLAEIQRHYGFLGQDQLRHVARELGFPLARVYGVATFYNLLLFDPPGKFQVRVCRGTACHVNQSLGILRALSEHLGIDVDETTADGRFTLQTVACVGACSLAPVLLINDESHGRMSVEAAQKLLAELAGNDDGESARIQNGPEKNGLGQNGGSA